MTEAPATRDWRDTVFLPQTPFPMKAGLAQKEPAILARWQALGLYERLREARAGAETFILHDGPPYANGEIHIGHALNHILKDMVCRTKSLLGYDAPYVPGWDCHGLPIEWKIEEQYRKEKREKPVPGPGADEAELETFRAECRAYAAHWVEVQTGQLQRLGILGNWAKPYLTMAYEAEATIVAELMKFAKAGMLYRGAKPVMWSPVERTALAEAEVEYEEITSTQVDVAFEIIEAPEAPELVGAHAVVWTTTPWTIPVNQAIAYGPEVEYTVFEIKTGEFDDKPELEWLREKRLVVASALVPTFLKRIGCEFDNSDAVHTIYYGGWPFQGAVARHPMHRLGGFFAAARPFLPGDFVTTDQGTGLVHMAPDHGEDDFELCGRHGIGPVFAVEGDGRYRPDWAWLGGQGSVINPKFNAPDGPICRDLADAGALLSASQGYRHSYPHSWRSKAKLIFRATPQWFVPMDRGAEPLRNCALSEIERVRWVPAKAQNRIAAMVEGRPDWVISRQRAWGVPITLFVDRRSGQPLVDDEVNARIVAAVAQEGVDAWRADRAADYLGPDRDPADYERVTDILDVWFDSGCTHAFVLESGEWPDLRWPADLYVEGSDQHRGWFQSSLLESCATRGRAPYRAVLTHGFTMDQAGRKMSKSLGNTIDPVKLMAESGADILRLWALSVDFTEDHRIGNEILAGVGDQYRKLRNTFRYLLGALDGFSAAERVGMDAMPELERFILHRLAELDAGLRSAVEAFDFNAYVRLLTDFMADDLSAFFFDVRKDRLYCDAPDDPARRAYRTVLDMLFEALVRYAAPVLVFTAEEVWLTRFPEEASVHLLLWPEADPGWRDAALGERWRAILAERARVTEAIEPLRRDKIIRSSLEAVVRLPAADLPTDPAHFAELCIVAAVEPGAAMAVTRTDWAKCGRCWRHLPEVAEDGALCDRCASVVKEELAA